MKHRTSESKACNTNNKCSVERGLFNLRLANDEERREYLERRRETLADGSDAQQDVGLATSGSRGIEHRTFQQWDAKERRYRKWAYDAIAERWVELDTRPRWQQDLDAVRARLAAKGKLPRGA